MRADTLWFSAGCSLIQKAITNRGASFRFLLSRIGVVVIIAIQPIHSPAYAAGDGLTKTEKAEIQRERARQKARSLLTRPDIVDILVGQLGHQVDYDSLSQQITRLAAVVRSLGQSMNNISMNNISLPRGIDGNQPESASRRLEPTYGTTGPTVKSVKLILEFRLMIVGNPRLKVGKVSEDAKRVVAHVTTTDGSLVEEYSIDKQTGDWTTLR